MAYLNLLFTSWPRVLAGDYGTDHGSDDSAPGGSGPPPALTASTAVKSMLLEHLEDISRGSGAPRYRSYHLSFERATFDSHACRRPRDARECACRFSSSSSLGEQCCLARYVPVPSTCGQSHPLIAVGSPVALVLSERFSILMHTGDLGMCECAPAGAGPPQPSVSSAASHGTFPCRPHAPNCGRSSPSRHPWRSF